MSPFSRKLSAALLVVEGDMDALGAMPGASGAGVQSKAQANAAIQKNEVDIKKKQAKQKDVAAQAQADQLYKQYSQVKQEVDRAEQEAGAKQDINLYNKVANLRKAMEAKYKAWQMVQAKAAGQIQDPNQTGMPPEAATGGI